jgi:hypothetical protein
LGIEAAEHAVDTTAGKSRERSGQGFHQGQAIKVAIEAHATDAAIEQWNQRRAVEEVHGNKKHDLVCIVGADEIRIEVEGTMTAGDQVILAPNEVAHARNHPALSFLSEEAEYSK